MIEMTDNIPGMTGKQSRLSTSVGKKFNKKCSALLHDSSTSSLCQASSI